jgi:ABC-type transport system substrate-binding protein
MTKGWQKLAFTLTYASGSTTISHIAQLMQSDWAQEGIDASLQQMPVNQLFGEDTQSSPTKWNMGYWGAGWTSISSITTRSAATSLRQGREKILEDIRTTRWTN